MPVMKQLNVGGTTYDTVGEASVTQVVSTGTKIATVSIDGTSTDLYAPSGGSSVEPATAAPIVDGTAAVGTSVKYAREDHVHPTDTSRQATLVSGTNIKTINGDSILGSGDLTVGGSVTMEDTAVDAAVNAAWPVSLHTVTIHSTAEGLVSVNKQSAAEGETVTLTVLVFLGKNNLAIKEYIGGVEGDPYAYPNVVMAGDYYQFTMPAYDLIITNYS